MNLIKQGENVQRQLMIFSAPVIYILRNLTWIRIITSHCSPVRDGDLEMTKYDCTSYVLDISRTPEKRGY